MRLLATFALCFAIIAVSGDRPTAGQPAALPKSNRASDYTTIKDWYLSVTNVSSTASDRLVALRRAVASGPYGTRGLKGLFKDFEGRWSFDPRLPGVEKNLLLTASQNANVRKGAARTHLYQTRLQNDPRFKLIGLNKLVNTAAGKTDHDIDFEHSWGGNRGRIEVKEITPESQRIGLSKYKSQIDKMAAELKDTGELQVFVNRRGMIPQLKRYAERKGILVFDNVVTSDRLLRPHERRFDDVLDDLSRRQYQASWSAAANGGMEAGFGVLLLLSSAPVVYDDLEKLLDPDLRSQAAALHLAQHGMLTIGGTAIAARGSAEIASALSATVSENGWVGSSSRWAGRFGLAAITASYGFNTLGYLSGSITERQFAVSSAGLVFGTAAGVGGGWIGGWAGGLLGGCIGSFGGPAGAATGASVGAAIGAGGGSVGGGYLGASLAENATEKHYELKDRRQQQELAQWLAASYDSSRPIPQVTTKLE